MSPFILKQHTEDESSACCQKLHDCVVVCGRNGTANDVVGDHQRCKVLTPPSPVAVAVVVSVAIVVPMPIAVPIGIAVVTTVTV